MKRSDHDDRRRDSVLGILTILVLKHEAVDKEGRKDLREILYVFGAPDMS